MNTATSLSNLTYKNEPLLLVFQCVFLLEISILFFDTL